jgi:hypothetical protein
VAGGSGSVGGCREGRSSSWEDCSVDPEPRLWRWGGFSSASAAKLLVREACSWHPRSRSRCPGSGSCGREGDSSTRSSPLGFGRNHASWAQSGAGRTSTRLGGRRGRGGHPAALRTGSARRWRPGAPAATGGASSRPGSKWAAIRTGPRGRGGHASAAGPPATGLPQAASGASGVVGGSCRARSAPGGGDPEGSAPPRGVIPGAG